MRLLLFALILCGAIAPFSSVQAQGLNDTQRKEVESLIGDYLRSNPEVILEAIRSLQARDQAEQQKRQRESIAARREQIEADPASPVIGNPDGDVTVVEFFDYRCGYCKSMLPVVQRLLEEDVNVRYVMKELPILSPESRIAAKFALAVWDSDKPRYFALHSRLMAARGDLTEERIFDIARGLGIDVERAKHGMESRDVEEALAANMELAQALGITGTPGFVIGDRLIPGAIGYATLKQLIEDARGAS